jgi:hypothetical protein
MFGVGWAELLVVAGMLLALTVVWNAWRERWVRVSREWRLAVSASDIEEALADSFAAAPGGRWRAQADGSWVYTVRRVPLWAVLLGVLTLPLGLLLLLVKETADLHVRLVRDEEGCRVRAIGRTPTATAGALDSWLTRMAQREQV